MELLWKSSHISGGNATYVEDLYETYLKDPNAVPEEWRGYFDSLPRVNGNALQDVPHSTVRDRFAQIGKMRVRTEATVQQDSKATEYERKQVRVVQLISTYRQRGHQKAKLDPLGLAERQHIPDLELAFHELSTADFDTVFQTGSLHIGKADATLGEIVDAMERTYCNTVGAEFMHIVATEERHWIMQRMESVRCAPDYGDEVRRKLLRRLIKAEGLEKSLGSKYPGTKRFGLEGGESLIPMLSEMVQRSGGYGAKEIVIGMAHRGRLNVLVNVFGKKPSELFDEFEGKVTYTSSGDVKYHQGFSSNVMTEGGECHLALAFNPSHLEIVSPVVEGSVRARQDRRLDPQGNTVVPIVLHGDAAFAGQGVVMETFQMSQTRGYRTGGTIHVVLNNQIGFTTSRRADARSTEYCTDIAKMVQAPIFHVNADDPEAVLFVTQLAVDYRNEFTKDVVLDLVCYRRRGHNEADEPSTTQPLMYEKIKHHPTTRDLYAQRLIASGVITAEEDEYLVEELRASLDRDQPMVKSLVHEPNSSMFVDWEPYLGHNWDIECDTSIPIKRLQELGAQINQSPEGVPLQRQVNRILTDRRKMAAGSMEINWGFAETMAYATLLQEDYPIRLTGQDVGRGTFSHRHAVLHNQKDGSIYIPLQKISKEQPVFEIYDSLLSEEAVLAFEYGYATTAPKGLVIWEAQFGDFANGAQVVIDQFITSGEHKWNRVCGLTLLLPHGYEGQGPEHSSARLERFLQLCAEHNIQVCVPTTPAQVYHMLRRQAIRPLRTPLIVMSPKSLLRHKQAVSTIEDLASGCFQNVLPETDDLDSDKVRRVVLCSGKVYYDLRDARRDRGIDDIALVRMEQLYPFPEPDLFRILQQYPNLKDAIWCQEEPMNQGAWYSSQHHMRRVLFRHKPEVYLHYVGRDAAAAPAAGYMALHLEQQERLINAALAAD
ncbi:2-oxoglutarate dehydrogenase E1 component [Halieaceae bacterium IMCC14734]|uniref:oxoglutarate dehydrogenase (succinyl-transferring) n=1 Tax=Candidatus Litorirhabdus singularis TaxID=2518993 RepID=A0ABT3TGN3_9GAMM|nr:2-oxoglutarate dehydrogenase E1 component [Candidatus Litorirhabdus singularis]MCX2981478.1 2-oxoglutarate dehydrogenase E1 component [Candidatus Litorirhabdus singularis]